MNLESQPTNVSWQRNSFATTQCIIRRTATGSKTKFYLEVFLFNCIFQVELLIFQTADSLMVVLEDTLNCLCDGHTQTLRHTQTRQ